MEIDLKKPTRPQICAVLGITTRWLGELRSKGEMPADGATMAANITAWVDRNQPKRDSSSPEQLDRDQQQARLAKEQADAKAMDNAERRKELASLPDMTTAVIGVITLAVSRLQKVPALVAKADPKLRAKLETAINDALHELSVTRVEEIISGDLSDGEIPEEGET